MSPPRIDLTAADLFGNDAAEDEDEEVFSAYVLDRPELASFLDPVRRICIVRAFKGEGKSALLRIVQNRLKRAENPPLVISVTGKQLSPTLSVDDTDEWARQWKRALLHLLACELGKRVDRAWNDDAITLVEEAEQSGFKSRSIISAIFDRLKLKEVPIDRQRIPAANPEKLIERWAARTDGIWFVIDDVDENFKNAPRDKQKVASLFIAVRAIANAIPQIRLRIAIRPNTWTMLVQEFEALSKVEQYISDLRWTQSELRDLLAARIKGYLVRRNQWQETQSHFKRRPLSEDLIGLVFESPVIWAGKTRDVHVPLVTLSRRRPRWLVELARDSASAARENGRRAIALDDITSCLERLGKRRISDTVAEFSAQCAQVEELIAAFSRQPEEYATNQLIETINDRILQAVTPRISGVMGQPAAVDVAAFLFNIGFLSARRTLENGEYEHLTYSDQPNLLRSRTNIDDGVRWEIHPIFRQALLMRDASGRSLRPIPTDRRGR